MRYLTFIPSGEKDDDASSPGKLDGANVKWVVCSWTSERLTTNAARRLRERRRTGSHSASSGCVNKYVTCLLSVTNGS